MKTVKETLLERRTIRRYTRDKIEQEKTDIIFEAIRNTQTSCNGQQFTVIAITGQELKEQLYEITSQKQIKTCALFLVFCVDFHKLKVAAQTKRLEVPRVQDTIDGYTVAVIDASLAMQNAVVAAESMRLGTCCIGYTRTSDPAHISRLLQLPEGVAVVCGLAIGYPAELPDLKPKLPLSLVIHNEHYRTDDMSKEFMKYDRLVSDYNAERSGDKSSHDWVGHILTYNAEQHDMESYLEAQGLHIGFCKVSER